MTTLEMARVTATLTAQNTFTDALQVDKEERVSVSVVDVSDSTVTIQRQIDGSNWRDVENWTADIETSYWADERCLLRIGIKTGNYGTDTVVVRLGKG